MLSYSYSMFDLANRAYEVWRKKGTRRFIEIATNYILIRLSRLPIIYYPIYIAASKELKSIKHDGSPEEVVDKLFEFDGYGAFNLRTAQEPEELKRACKIVSEENPKTVVEIGTMNGGTLWAWTQVFDEAEKFISIDLPGGNFGGEFGGYTEREAKFFQRFSEEEIICIRDDSHKKRTLDKLEEKLAGDKIDFLFIDGDHTYEGVKQDWEMYRDLVAKDGIIGFHDITWYYREDCEVWKLWDEIKSEYNVKEIVKEDADRTYGIGLVFMEKD